MDLDASPVLPILDRIGRARSLRVFLAQHAPYLTWWKRTVDTLIEKGCDMLSYPWGDRIESTVGNFGIWVQITLAILIFRTIIGTVLILIRATRRR